MRDALPGITSGDEDVIGIERIATDEGEIVGRFHYLTGPAKLNRASLRKTFACPLLEPRVTIGAVVGLAGLVVFTADDQHVVVLKALKPEVVIRIECVPVQRVRDRSFGDFCADYVRDVRRLFRVNRDTIVYGRVRRNDDHVASNNRTMATFDVRVLTAFDCLGMCFVEQTPAVTADRTR